MTGPIGILGLGLIGGVLGRRLVAAGHAVFGYDPVVPAPSSVALLDSAGAVFEHCQTVILSLPHGEVVQSVVEEVRAGLSDGHVIINTTTGAAEDLPDVAPARMLEACIAGSSQVLEDGEALVFLGGGGRVIEEAHAILEVISPRCVRLGELGAASRFKLVHNMAIGLNRAVLAETLQFAEALGFDAAQTLGVLKESPAASVAMSAKGQKMIEATYEPPQARLSQHLKDVRLMLEAAERVGAQVPLSTLHKTLLEKAEALGYGQVDNAAVIEVYRDQEATSC